MKITIFELLQLSALNFTAGSLFAQEKYLYAGIFAAMILPIVAFVCFREKDE